MKTEERIVKEAKDLFLQKGFKGTTVRDIATNSGVNIALVNYYFRSKEKLFHHVMEGFLKEFLATLVQVVNEEDTTLDYKLKTIVRIYIDTLKSNPDLPLFILSELRKNPEHLINLADPNKTLQNSALAKQVMEAKKQGKMAFDHPSELIMNLAGLTVFPFIARPLLIKIFDANQQEFDGWMDKRKESIPENLMSIFFKKN